MDEFLKGFARIGFWIIILGVVLLFFQRPGSAEFIVTILSIILGAVLVALVVLVNRLIR